MGYSYLRATIGSIREARRAGKTAARTDTPRITLQAAARVIGSVGVISKSSVLRTRVSAREPARPTARAIAPRASASRRTKRTTSAERAPRATRIPISLVRSLTEYETRSEEHTSELQSRFELVCRPLLEK